MLLPFRLISAILKQLSRDITNDIIVKYNNSLEEGYGRN